MKRRSPHDRTRMPPRIHNVPQHTPILLHRIIPMQIRQKIHLPARIPPPAKINVLRTPLHTRYPHRQHPRRPLPRRQRLPRKFLPPTLPLAQIQRIKRLAPSPAPQHPRPSHHIHHLLHHRRRRPRQRPRQLRKLHTLHLPLLPIPPQQKTRVHHLIHRRPPYTQQPIRHRHTRPASHPHRQLIPSLHPPILRRLILPSLPLQHVHAPTVHPHPAVPRHLLRKFRPARQQQHVPLHPRIHPTIPSELLPPRLRQIRNLLPRHRRRHMNRIALRLPPLLRTHPTAPAHNDHRRHR